MYATKRVRKHTKRTDEVILQVTELIQKAKEGDREAFAELYKVYSKKLYSTALYMLGRREDAEDLVMDTVMDAFRGIRTLRDADAFEGWIFKILVNKIKRKRKSYIDEPVELLEEILPEQDAPGENRVLVFEAMKTLSGEDRDILILGIVNGYKSEEIAALLGMNSYTVRSRQKRALEKLRRILEKGDCSCCSCARRAEVIKL